MKGIHLDPDSGVTGEVFALVCVPGRQRNRYSESSVILMESAEAALRGADPGQRRYAARLMGPSRSSEGVRLYYLLDWLDPDCRP